jgi:hypothetical protein
VRGKLAETSIDFAKKALIGKPDCGVARRFGELCTLDQPSDRGIAEQQQLEKSIGDAVF